MARWAPALLAASMALAQTYGDTRDDNTFDIDSLTMQEPVLPSAIAPLLSCRKGLHLALTETDLMQQHVRARARE